MIIQFSRRAPALAFAFLALAAGPGFAHDGVNHSGEGALHGALLVGPIEISGAFARATLPNAPVGGGFMTLTNTGAEDDRLVAVRAGVAQRVELHEMALVGDVMQMRHLPEGIALPAGGTVTLAPGGLHVMFMGINQAFVEGQCVEAVLTFERAGDAEVCIPIASAAAREPEGVGEGHEEHGEGQPAAGHHGH